MSSISNDELKAIKTAVSRIAKKYRVAGVCLYGSRIAGYSRADSDFDVIIVLNDYPYAVKYIYTAEADMKISALVVDRATLEKDAASAFLGEFVVGRLLHIYEPIQNNDLFERIEIVYKKRVILDEIYNIVKSANVLSTQIIFPLEYIMFSKVRYRSILYPNAAYSYYQTYTGKNSHHNIEFALNGYQRALKEILADDKELLIIGSSGRSIQISERRVDVHRNHKVAYLKLTKKLQEFSSYFIHAYAGRHTLRHVVREAESKISRHKTSRVMLPNFISSPKDLYWRLPEGLIVIDDKDWLDKVAKLNGLSRYVISKKDSLGIRNGATTLYVLEDPDNQNVTKSLVVKEMTRSNRARWTSFRKLSSTIDRPKVDSLFRLGNEYRALRYIRSVGLNTPIIQSVVLAKRILVTEFLEGKLISDILKECLDRNNIDVDLKWITIIGQHIARVHAYKCTLGHIKPSNLIVYKNRLYFTGIEEFGFNSGDPLLDIVLFMSHALAKTTNIFLAKRISEEFFEGYSKEMPAEYLKKVVKSGYYYYYADALYTMLNPSVAETIKKEITKFVN
jgi:tRNA A-37 threonylcarbamoyl transferase component Bud32/predicted nucleotidyltransferase